MNTFMVPELTNATISKPVLNNKKVIYKKDVRLIPLLSADLGKTYKVEFMLSILDNNIPIRKINTISLRKAILGNVSKYDLKYMTLVRFDTKKAVFYFDLDKWMKDATNNLKDSKSFSKFSRVFKFKVAPPKMIMEDTLRDNWGNFILRHFKRKVEKEYKQKKYFKHLLPEITNTKIKNKVANMFDWEYDIQWNRATATLKSVWIIALLFSVGVAVNKISKNDMKSNKKEMFADKVTRNLSNFDKLKFDKFISKKYIFYK